MKKVLIRREDVFPIIALIGEMQFISAGALWCTVVLSDRQLAVLGSRFPLSAEARDNVR